MRELGLRWYVFGAQAAIVHGRPRMTADVDITIDPGQTSTPALLEELSRAGFSLRMAFSEDFLQDVQHGGPHHVESIAADTASTCSAAVAAVDCAS